MRARKWRAAILGGAVGLAFTASPAFPQDPAALERAARGEGEVVLRTEEENSKSRRVCLAFAARFAGLKCRFTREPSSRSYQDYLAELRSGGAKADVLQMADGVLLLDLHKRRSLARFAAPEYRAYPPEYIGPENAWFVHKLQPLVISYNSGRIQPAEAPRRWKDLLDPRWRGRVGVADPALGGAASTFVYGMMKLEGPGFFRRLGANQPKILPGLTFSSAQVASGELDVAVNLLYLVLHFRERRKMPIGFVIPPEGAPVEEGLTAIAALAPHPNAARLFVNFLASREGQEAFHAGGWTYSARPGVRLDPELPPFTSFKKVRPQPEEVAAKGKEWTEQARRALGGR